MSVGRGAQRKRVTLTATVDPPRIRPATPDDAQAIVDIYADSAAERNATFDTEAPPVADVARQIASPDHFFLVAETPEGEVLGWASVGPYSNTRAAYAGVGECSIYVAPAARSAGLGTRLTEETAAVAEQKGLFKLLGKLFTTNEPSRRLVRRCGFRDVGVHLCHGQLDGEWRDVLVVERLLGPAAAEQRRRG